MSLNFIKIEDESKFFIRKENIYFSVTEIMFSILEKHQLNWSTKEIADYLNTESKTTFYTNEIIDSILSDEKVQKILQEGEVSASMTDYIFFKKKLIDPVKIKGLLKLLSVYLFNKKWMLYLSFFSSFVTVFYGFYFYDYLLLIKNQMNLNPLQELPIFIIVYVIFILIIFIHELGHAGAAYTYGILPKQIGFGFYYTMPVLYTELTDIWSLKRKEKIMVNIGGIYFQLLLNSLFVFFLFFNPDMLLLNILFVTNTFSLLFALNPFFKNDGYWIFSDYFNIYNLETKADKCFIQLFRFMFTPKKSFEFLKSKGKILIIYSFINFLFWFYFFYSTTKYMIINANMYYHSMIQKIDFIILGKILLYLFFVFMFIKSTYTRIISIVKNK